MKKIVWDTENEQEANNWDGSDPIIEDEQVFIKELGCNCEPPGCGGCIDITECYEIGKSQYVWKAI